MPGFFGQRERLVLFLLGRRDNGRLFRRGAGDFFFWLPSRRGTRVMVVLEDDVGGVYLWLGLSERGRDGWIAKIRVARWMRVYLWCNYSEFM